MRALVKVFALDVPALTASVLLGLNRHTVQHYYDLLRLRILELAVDEARPFTGEVEVDESYFGPRRVRGKRGRGAGGKTPVIGLLKRGGKVFTEIVENCSKQALMPIIKGQVLSAATVYTDGWKSYEGLVLGGYKHHRIHHHENQFARGKNHVNGIESFGASPNCASPNSAASRPMPSSSTSKNPSGASIIDTIISPACSSNN